MESTIETRIKQKRDSLANWETKNPVLLDGEIIFVRMADGSTRQKTGDGTSTFKQLPYSDDEVRERIDDVADTIPTKVSQLENDSGFITEDALSNLGAGDMLKSVYDTDGDGVVDNAEKLGGVAASEYVKSSSLGSLATKSTISKTDLATDVQTSLGKADTALQSYTETDPTVPSWAKASTKPKYTAEEVGALPADTVIPTVPTKVSAFENDKGYLTSFTETDPTVPSHVKNIKESDITNWNNKSNFDGNYNSLTNKPTIPTVNNATLTIQKNGTNVATFTANSSTNATANITVPTTASEVGAVPTTRKVNGKALSADITLGASDVGADASGSANTALTNAKSYTDTKISELINSAPTTLDTLGEIATAMEENAEVVEALESAIGSKANSSDLTSHTSNKSNPHGVTKAQVGLGSVVNTGDSATPVSGGTTKFTTGGAYTELAKKVDKTTTVNGHELSGNVTVTKGDVGLGNVDNTADANKSVKYATSAGSATSATTASKTTGTLTVQKNGTNVTTFNGSGNATANITVPTKVSELTNDSGYKTTDNNTTYTLTKSGSTITLTGSDGSETSVTDSDTNTTYSLSSFGITSTATELNYTDGVTSNIQTQLNGKVSTDMGYVNKSLSWNSNSYIQHVILLFPVPQSATYCGHNFVDGRFFCWKIGGNVYDTIEINANCVYGSLRYHLEQFGDHPTTELCVCKYNNVQYYALKCPYHANPYTNVTFVGRIKSDLTGGTSTVTLPLDVPYYNENTATVLNSEVKNSLTTTLTTTYVTAASTTALYSKGGFAGSLSGNASTATKATYDSNGNNIASQISALTARIAELEAGCGFVATEADM